MNPLALSNFVNGAIAACCWLVAMYFLAFWRRTRDRFFLLFSAAFTLLGLGRLAMSVFGATEETYKSIYLLRLFAYLIFLAAIIDKNRD